VPLPPPPLLGAHPTRINVAAATTATALPPVLQPCRRLASVMPYIVSLPLMLAETRGPFPT